MRDEGWPATPRAQRFFTDAHARMVGSQICEDGFNEEKNAVPYKNRRVAVEGAYYTLISRKSLSTKHDFLDVQPSAVSVRDRQLSNDAYMLSMPCMPASFREVTSFASTPTWVSPRAEDWSVPFADLVMVQQARAQEGLDKIKSAWLGALFDLCSKLIVREKRGAISGPWRLAMGHLSGSCGIAWPMDQRCIPDSDSKYFVLAARPRNVRDCFVAVLDLDNWEAQRVQWLSPYSQVLRFGAAARNFY